MAELLACLVYQGYLELLGFQVFLACLGYLMVLMVLRHSSLSKIRKHERFCCVLLELSLGCKLRSRYPLLHPCRM